MRLFWDTISVLSRKQKVSIWVEGAYGTGKSHAVLTLKKLLEANPEETKQYFGTYPDQLTVDLYNQFQQLKTDEQKILTVHRYGSSTIHGDESLVFALQESIENALKKNGVESLGQGALKDAVVKWISDSVNKAFFNSLITGPYRDSFGGDDADAVVTKLQTFTGDALLELMGKITKLAEERQIKALSLDTAGLVEWIKAIIDENNLKAIFFIWDEFTEYFRGNMRNLTGFQRIVDMSATSPFYLMIVTHDAMHIFPDGDKEFGKIRGRFIDPICEISLPDNMAFRLMGAAMTKKKDPAILKEWNDTVEDLYDRTSDSRKLVMKKAKITNKELKSILPIHPYTALLLKHISAAFDSNQRSMFDFIKNDRGDEIKGFQWFIDFRGPEDDNPLLTLDELWEFFYEKGKEYLSHDIRTVLDYYNYAVTQKLDSDERRVLKATLLMQAISQRVGSSVELFIPNVENINNAFEGSDMDQGEAGRLVEKLERDKILYKMPIGGGKFQYAARINVADDGGEIEKLKEQFRKKTTADLVIQGEVASAITFSDALKARFYVKTAGSSDLKSTANQIRGLGSSLGNKISAIITFARDDAESATIGKSIKAVLTDTSYDLIFIDASRTPLGSDLLEQYATAMANSAYQKGKNNTLSNQYEKDAKDLLKKWRQRVECGEFIIFSANNLQGLRANTIESLFAELNAINRKRYPLGLETGNSVVSSMWDSNSIKLGVESGSTETLEKKGAYGSGTANNKLDKYIGENAWKHKNYWIDNPYLLISKIKIRAEEIIKEGFNKNGQVSIKEIYSAFTGAPYGFMPCNLTAFVMGFILKEYTDSAFTYTDGVTNDSMSVEKLKNMVDEVIKLQITPNSKYKDKYIRTMTLEEKAFHDASAQIFDISRCFCTTVETTRERIRNKMKTYSFPIWCLQYILDNESLKTDKEILKKVIVDYSGIANSGNVSGNRTDSDIAFEIGSLCMTNETIVSDMKALLIGEKCKAGMQAYVAQFSEGELVKLAAEVGDNGQYINRLQKKFDADAANWVWNKETANQKIQEVILEYKIIVESNKINPKALSFDNAIAEWCDKCKRIKISYFTAKTYWNELGLLMELLYKIKKSGSILDSQKELFLQQLNAYGETFKKYYENQIDIFKQACSFYLTEFVEADIKDLYQSIKGDVFTMERNDYSNLVKDTVEAFKLSRKSIQMRKLWQEKTASETPYVWSEIYKMPILCMVPDAEVTQARAAFDTLNQKHPGTSDVETALAYLEKATFFEILSDQAERDKAFKKNIITEQFDVILKDVQEVKNYLNRILGKPYYWYGNPQITSNLKKMAQAKYDENGCTEALKKIDEMDVADVKKYLKRLIQDNMTVGIEIIKDN